MEFYGVSTIIFYSVVSPQLSPERPHPSYHLFSLSFIPLHPSLALRQT